MFSLFSSWNTHSSVIASLPSGNELKSSSLLWLFGNILDTTAYHPVWKVFSTGECPLSRLWHYFYLLFKIQDPCTVCVSCGFVGRAWGWWILGRRNCNFKQIKFHSMPEASKQRNYRANTINHKPVPSSVKTEDE